MDVLEVVKEGVGMVVEASTGNKEDTAPQNFVRQPNDKLYLKHLQDMHVTTYCTADTSLLHWEIRG